MSGRYGQELVDRETLLAYLEVRVQAGVEEQRELEVAALAFYSQALYEACLSSEEVRRNHGFSHLQRYLESVLAGKAGLELVRAEVLQQTLYEVWNTLHMGGTVLSQPTAFLRWAQVILSRQL